MPLPILPSAIDLSPFCCEILPLRISSRPPPRKAKESFRWMYHVSLSLFLSRARAMAIISTSERFVFPLVAYQLFPITMHFAVTRANSSGRIRLLYHFDDYPLAITSALHAVRRYHLYDGGSLHLLHGHN